MIRNLLAALLAMVLLTGAVLGWRQLDQPVRSVRVEGALTTAEQQAIRQVVSDGLEGGLLSLGLDDLTRRIRDLSWPRVVTVRRVWPDGLVIRVEKEAVVAVWGAGGYLTSAGKIVQLADAPDALPTLAAELSSPQKAMEMYQVLQARVNPLDLHIERLEENALGEWLLHCTGGMTVALGNEALTERVQRFLLVYGRAQAADMQPIAHLDTRYENGVAVRWAEEPLLALEPRADRRTEQR